MLIHTTYIIASITVFCYVSAAEFWGGSLLEFDLLSLIFFLCSYSHHVYYHFPSLFFSLSVVTLEWEACYLLVLCVSAGYLCHFLLFLASQSFFRVFLVLRLLFSLSLPLLGARSCCFEATHCTSVSVVVKYGLIRP